AATLVEHGITLLVVLHVLAKQPCHHDVVMHALARLHTTTTAAYQAADVAHQLGDHKRLGFGVERDLERFVAHRGAIGTAGQAVHAPGALLAGTTTHRVVFAYLDVALAILPQQLGTVTASGEATDEVLAEVVFHGEECVGKQPVHQCFEKRLCLVWLD